MLEKRVVNTIWNDHPWLGLKKRKKYLMSAFQPLELDWRTQIQWFDVRCNCMMFMYALRSQKVIFGTKKNFWDDLDFDRLNEKVKNRSQKGWVGSTKNQTWVCKKWDIVSSIDALPTILSGDYNIYPMHLWTIFLRLYDPGKNFWWVIKLEIASNFA